MEYKRIVQQKDHIILPKSTLMRFIDNTNQKIYYLDLNDITIKCIFPKSYHVTPNYYNPEYDEIVKNHETAIGKLHKTILSAIEHGTKIAICTDALRKQIVDFVTIEFCRSVIANDTMLEEYKNRQQKRNDDIDSMLFRTGRMTPERINYSVNYRQKAESNESFRHYAQNILATKNREISALYNNFIPQILYIPKGSNYRFLLPPMHFVGNDQFLCCILSPTIALALYPVLNVNNPISEADREKVEIINLRILECASFFDPSYKEIVGERSQLQEMEKQIKKIKSLASFCESAIIIGNNEDFCLTSMNSVLELVITLYFLSGASEKIRKVQMKKQNFDAKFFETNQNEVAELLKKYSFDLTVQ